MSNNRLQTARSRLSGLVADPKARLCARLCERLCERLCARL